MWAAAVVWLARGASGLSIAVTGSSSGIGLEASRRLVKEGHTVYHACRSLERAEFARQEAGGGVAVACDLADLASVRSAAATIAADCGGKLDVLCLNAGIAPSTRGVTATRTVDGVEACVATNHVAHFLMANLLKPCLAVTNGILCVTASSVHDPDQPGGSVNGDPGATLGDLRGLGSDSLDMVDGGAYSGSKVYKDSKLCNVLFAREAAKRWGPDVRVRCFNPGFIPSSGLFREPRKDNFWGATAFTAVAGLAGLAVPVTVGGDRLAYMATAGDDDVPPGSYYSAETKSRATTKTGGFGPAPVSREALDDDLAKQLWDKTAALVKVDAAPAKSASPLSMAELKKFGVAGTVAYVLTELAFWAVAFPVAAATFANTVGHAPDLSDNGDRAAVLGYVFAGANIARLAVPLRFGAAFALAPWVDENIIARFAATQKDDDPATSTDK